MNTEMDDEELTFDDEPAPAPQAPSVNDKTAEPADVPEAKPEDAPAPEEAASPKAGEAAARTAGSPATGPARRSRTGMAVAAGFALCIVASAISAVQAWRAASIASGAHGNAADHKAMAARLNNIERLLEQQRDDLDALSANPNVPVAAAAGGIAAGDSQINALAAAVRANQAMNERLPSIIMQQVDSRLARVAPAARAAARPVTKKQAVAAKPKPKPVTKPAAVAKAPAPMVQAKSEPPVVDVAKRPAGEAIRYP